MLIFGTCIYQFSGRGKEIILDRIGWKLPLLDFLNAMYIYSWTIQEYRYGAYYLILLVRLPSKHPSALVFILFAVSVVTVSAPISPCPCSPPFADSRRCQQIYQEVKVTALRNFCDEVFLHLPFSLYHGWVVGLVFLSGFEAFGVDALTEPAGPWTKAFVFSSLYVLFLSRL